LSGSSDSKPKPFSFIKSIVIAVGHPKLCPVFTAFVHSILGTFCQPQLCSVLATFVSAVTIAISQPQLYSICPAFITTHSDTVNVSFHEPFHDVLRRYQDSAD
jgi:uncharacterized membrane-anchored protein YitT (DUF2179 family)